MAYKLNSEKFNDVIGRLSEDYDIIAPALMPFEMHHSNQDVYGYRKIDSFKEIVIDKKTFFSPKEFLFPPRETMFYFSGSQIEEASYTGKNIIILLRACDINGLERIKKIFLNNGDVEDTYFQRRLGKTKLWLIECDEGFDSCFCVSMNSNKTDNYSVALKFTDKGIYANLNDDIFLDVFKSFDKIEEYRVSFIEKNKLKVNVPLPENVDIDIFDNFMWNEYTQRCIACGRCNTSCVTCSCFTVQDIICDENKNQGERRRVWTGCHIDDFSLIAGGHDYRTKNGERMRFKTMHKIYDYNKRFGENMCVGCGRCDDVCPEYISFSKCINKLNDIIEEEKK
jgi:anaerobic sulfite reductase subunit A